MKKAFLVFTTLALLASASGAFATEPVSTLNGDPQPGLRLAASPTLSLPAYDGDGNGSKLNIGLGLGRYAFRNGYKLSVPPIGVSLDRPAFGDMLDVEWLTAGGYVGFARYTYGSDFYEWHLTEITIASRWGVSISELLADELPEKLDLYANLQIGYSILTWDDTYYGSVGSGLYAGITAGARLYLGKVGVFGEIGRTEGGWLRGGVTFAL